MRNFIEFSKSFYIGSKIASYLLVMMTTPIAIGFDSAIPLFFDQKHRSIRQKLVGAGFLTMIRN
jgi:hypothetical protein